jgi:7-cyano-7-deazaguanine synthase
LFLKAIVLFSGGIDSTTTLAIALHEGYQVFALSFDYGQRHRIELEKASDVLKQFRVIQHFIFKIDLTQIGGSALTADLQVPKSGAEEGGIPITYVPARNLIFLSLAAAYGEVNGAYDIFYGANVIDYSGYPDCRPEFIRSLENTINIGMKAGVEGKRFTIHAPLLQMTKAAIIKRGFELGIDFSRTHSCYDPFPDGRACGECDSCRIRAKGFREAGFEDPAATIRKTQ